MRNNKKVSLKRQFINECYDGDEQNYRKNRRYDWLRVQYQWTCWLDQKVKSGDISQKVWENATF